MVARIFCPHCGQGLDINVHKKIARPTTYAGAPYDESVDAQSIAKVLKKQDLEAEISAIQKKRRDYEHKMYSLEETIMEARKTVAALNAEYADKTDALAKLTEKTNREDNC